MNELLDVFVWFRWTLYAIIFMLGASIGSFCMVIGSRGVTGESPWKGRSHCCSCGHELNVIDLIPVFGWIIRGGKCKYCKAKIGVTYVIIEAICGAMFAFAFARYRISILTLLSFIIFAFMVITAIYDIELGEISDKYTVVIMITGVILGILTHDLWSSVINGTLALVLIILGYIFRDKIGGADIIVLVGILFNLDLMEFAFMLQFMGILGIIFVLIKNKISGETNFKGVEVRFLPIIYVSYAIIYMISTII